MAPRFLLLIGFAAVFVTGLVWWLALAINVVRTVGHGRFRRPRQDEPMRRRSAVTADSVR